MNHAEAELEIALSAIDRVLDRSPDRVVPPPGTATALPELMLGAGAARLVMKVAGAANAAGRVANAAGRLRALSRIGSPRLLRKAIWAPHSTRRAGVFLPDASRAEAHRWLQSWARQQMGHGAHYRIVHDDPHRPGGIPHFHIEAGPRRSAHIFYGPLPAGDFFAAA